MNDILDQAVKLKQSQVDKERPRWNSWPPYRQNSLFHSSHVAATRIMPTIGQSSDGTTDAAAMRDQLDRAYLAAEELKDRGNAAFAKSSVSDASFRYEEAVGQFDYVFATKSDWKAKGIRDQDVDLFTLSEQFNSLQAAIDDCDTPVERQAATRSLEKCKTLLATLYTNLSVVAARQTRWDVSASAAHYVLEHIDPRHAKSAFRYAVAITTPATATTDDTRKAVAALRNVLGESDHGTGSHPGREPQHIEACRNLLGTLETEMAQENTRKRAMFGGMFRSERWAQAGAAATTQGEPERDSWNETSLSADDPMAHSDARRFPARFASQTIFKDTVQGWAVVDRMRDDAGRLPSADTQGDALRGKAASLESELVQVCATKIFTEVIVPAMATSPILLRFDVPPVGEVDVLELRDSECIVHGRNLLRLLGFRAREWNAVCLAQAAGKGDDKHEVSLPCGQRTREALLFAALSERCRAAFTVDSVARLRPLDVANSLANAGLLGDEHVAAAAKGASEGETMFLRERATAERRRLWSRLRFTA
jgi:hypothetical protein